MANIDSQYCAICGKEIKGECMIVSNVYLKNSSVETDVNLREPIKLAHKSCVGVDDDKVNKLEKKLKDKKKYNKRLKTEKDNLKDKLEKTKDKLENTEKELDEIKDKLEEKNKKSSSSKEK